MTESAALEKPAELGRFTKVASIGLSGITVLAIVVLAVIHIDDLFSIHLTEGLRIALAKYANTGQLFPPLQEDGFYGGTRYMPLPIIMHGALSLVLGDYIVPGKILGLVYGFLTICAIVFILRKRGLPMPLALLLASVLPATNVGLKSITGFGAELLPVLLQITAIALVEDDSSRRNVLVSSLLVVLAVFCKITALWGLGAIVIWLLFQNRRRLVLFLGATVALLTVGWVILYAASSGRVDDSFFSILFSGTSLPLYSTFDRILGGIDGYAQPLLILVVPLVFGFVFARRPRWLSIFLIALCIHAATLVVMFLDPATAENHFVDLIVLVTLVVGVGVSKVERETLREWQLRLVAVAALWGVAIGAFFTLRDPVSEAIAVARGQRTFAEYTVMPLKEEVTELDYILASNPYIPISRGHRPIVLEPLLFLRLSEEHPELEAELAGRVRNKEFTKVVLLRELSEIKWYATFEFGLEVHAALTEAYELRGFADGYFVYVPKSS
jgi:uncharacterized membrane protein YqjE